MGKILAIIPARYGSKRIPHKNFVDLNGKPLIEHTIITALACAEIDHVVVSSDADEWADTVVRMGAEYMSRPPELCQDDTTDLPVIQHVLEDYKSADIELICYLRPTTPFRALYHIEQAIKYIRDTNFEDGVVASSTGLRSVELMAESAFKCYTMPTPWLSPIMDGYYDKTDWPNQKVTPTYRPNGYIDIIRPETLAKGQLWGNWCAGFVTPRTIEIDTKEDLEYARWWARRERPIIYDFGRVDL